MTRVFLWGLARSRREVWERISSDESCRNTQRWASPSSSSARSRKWQLTSGSLDEIGWVYQRNMLFLEDYLGLDDPVVSQESTDEILAQITGEPGIKLLKFICTKWLAERYPQSPLCFG